VKTLDVNGVVTTTTPVNTTQDNTTATTLFAAIYSRPVTTQVANQAGAIAGENVTFALDVFKNTLGQDIALGATEGFTIQWGGTAATDSVTFAQAATTRTTVDQLVTFMNADTALNAANMKLTAGRNAAQTYVYDITYNTITNGVSTAGIASPVASKVIGFELEGIKYQTGNVVAPYRQGEIAEALRTKINGLLMYSAVSNTGPNTGHSFVVTKNVSGTATADRSPLVVNPGVLSYDIDAAMVSTTLGLGANTVGFTTVSHLSNTFGISSSITTARFSIPNVTPTVRSGLRVTVKSTNGLTLTSNFKMMVSNRLTSNTTFSVINIGVGSNAVDPAPLTSYKLVDGVSIASAANNTSTGLGDTTATTYYVAAAANAGVTNVSTAGITAISTDRTGWL